MVQKLVGASVWEEELYEHLTTHEQNERDILLEYQEAAQRSQSPAFQYLVGLIVEDEIRHHRLYRDLAETIKSDVELRPEQPAVPRLDSLGPDADGIIALTEELLERERADARQLAHLAKDLRDVKDTTLWELLVELMEKDTAKHINILEFVRRHAGKRWE